MYLCECLYLYFCVEGVLLGQSSRGAPVISVYHELLLLQRCPPSQTGQLGQSMDWLWSKSVKLSSSSFFLPHYVTELDTSFHIIWWIKLEEKTDLLGKKYRCKVQWAYRRLAIAVICPWIFISSDVQQYFKYFFVILLWQYFLVTISRMLRMQYKQYHIPATDHPAPTDTTIQRNEIHKFWKMFPAQNLTTFSEKMY